MREEFVGFGWWDTFNEVRYTSPEDAERARAGGNTIIPLYRQNPLLQNPPSVPFPTSEERTKMKIGISGIPRFHFPLSREHLATLLACSAAHYDGRCRAAGEMGGVLYGWKNLMEFSPPGSLSISVTASWDQVDTLAKIVEQLPSPEHRAAVEQLRVVFRTALQWASAVMLRWKEERDV